MSTASTPLTTADVGAMVRNSPPGPYPTWEQLLATTRALEAETELAESAQLRAEKAEARHDEARALMERAFEGQNYERLRKDEWKAMAEAAQADVERLVREKAELVAALKSALAGVTSRIPRHRARVFSILEAALAKVGG